MGKLILGKMLAKGGNIDTFPLSPARYQQFREAAGKRRLRYAAIMEKNAPEKEIAVAVPEEDKALWDDAIAVWTQIPVQPGTAEETVSPVKPETEEPVRELKEPPAEVLTAEELPAKELTAAEALEAGTEKPPEEAAKPLEVLPPLEAAEPPAVLPPEERTVESTAEIPPEEAAEPPAEMPPVEVAEPPAVLPPVEKAAENQPTVSENRVKTMTPRDKAEQEIPPAPTAKTVWTARKNAGHIEPDMQERNVTDRRNGRNAFYIADYVLKKYPLAGEYIPTREEELLLYRRAQQAVEKILDDIPINMGDAAVLFVETVNHLKDWSSNLGKSNKENTFWNYIFRQYGFQVERYGGAEKNRLYEKFRMAIDSVLDMRHYARFTASDGHRYYTTLLLHALAPRHSIENFFDILFHFYADNLGFQYVPGDSSYKSLTRGMQMRWDVRLEEDGNPQLRSLDVLAGLRVLFLERPGFMTALCDTLVRKMDALLRGDSSLDTQSSYWDRLLAEWYQKKGARERETIRREIQNQQAEYVAVSREHILLRYGMERSYGRNEAVVGLSLPKIRLTEAEEKHPVIRIYQDEEEIYQDSLSVMGDNLCLTIRSRFFPLKEIGYRFSRAPALRVEIWYRGDILYQSGDRLNRAFLLFDEDGNELLHPTAGTVWLFAATGTEIIFDNEDGVWQLPHPGQLYRIHTGEVSSAIVSGKEVFSIHTPVSRFRCESSVRPLSGLRAITGEKPCAVYSGGISLTLFRPDGTNAKRYQVSVDGTRLAVDPWKDGKLLLTPPDSPGVPHTVRVIDLVDDTVKFDYSYLILPDCSVRTGKPLYRAAVDEVHLTVSWVGQSADLSFPPLAGADSVAFSLPGLGIQWEAEIPVVHAALMGGSAFQAPPVLWHREIPDDTFLTLRLPDGWEGRLMLDAKEIPSSAGSGDRRFELGNALRGGIARQPVETLWLSLRNGGVMEKYKISEIAFRPRFLAPPVTAEEGRILWRAEENYIGDAKSRFVIVCETPDGQELRFRAGMQDTYLTEEPLEDGYYSCQVFLQPQSVFAAGPGEPVYGGGCLIGDSRKIALSGKEILLCQARYWNIRHKKYETLPLRSDCGILRGFSYLGESVADGEEVSAPHYTATLYYTNGQGQILPFSDAESEKTDKINPVNLWIMNEHLLILLSATDDALYLDKKYRSLFKWKPDVLKGQDPFARLEIPDYFLYRIRDSRPGTGKEPGRSG